MDKSTVINLISETQARDTSGVYQTSETSHTVFCSVNSVTASEFFEGGRNGLNPELQFTMFAGDYNGERIVEYDGNRYGVYRTYIRKNDVIELYVERKGGLNGN